MRVPTGTVSSTIAALENVRFLGRIREIGMPAPLYSTVQDPKTWRPKRKIGPSCYMPHQGKRERIRRCVQRDGSYYDAETDTLHLRRLDKRAMVAMGLES